MTHLRQFFALAAALVVGGTMIGGTAAHAQSAAYYVAVPAVQPTRTSLVTRETPWSLKGNAYVAARAPERDAMLCAAVAKSVGALSSFTVAGKPYEADQLATCNSHAKGGAANAAVAQAR